MWLLYVLQKLKPSTRQKTSIFNFFFFFQKITLALNPMFMVIRSLLPTETDPKGKEKGFSGLWDKSPPNVTKGTGLSSWLEHQGMDYQPKTKGLPAVLPREAWRKDKIASLSNYHRVWFWLCSKKKAWSDTKVQINLTTKDGTIRTCQNDQIASIRWRKMISSICIWEQGVASEQLQKLVQ